MNATRGADPREVVAGRAAGYGWERNAHRNCAPLTLTAAFSAGSLLSTAHDLTLWDAALRDDSLLPRARREEMWTGATLADGSTGRYGYGWGVHQDYLGRRLIEHSGGTGGFSSHLARFPDDDLSVVVLANLRAVEAREIAREVAGLIVPALKPPGPTPLEDKEPGVAVLVAEVLRAVADGSLGPERFTPELWANIFPDRVREGAGGAGDARRTGFGDADRRRPGHGRRGAAVLPLPRGLRGRRHPRDAATRAGRTHRRAAARSG
jgi:hypothetical protein